MNTDVPILLPCGAANLRRAARTLSSAYDEALRATGMRGQQFSLLRAIADRGELTQGELGALLSLDTTTLTRTLAPLVSGGLIARVVGEDRRERRLALTPGGRKALRKAEVAWDRVQARMRSAVGAARWDRLQNDLLALTIAATAPA